MKLGTEDKKRLIQAAIAVPLALIGLVYLYVEVFGGSSPAPAPAPVAVTSTARPGPAGSAASAKGTSAKRLATSPVKLDPTLHPEVMAAAESLIYTGNGRNIFSTSAAPVVIEKPIASARPVKTGPVVPAVYTPPPPPPIDLKFFGTETSADGVRRAFLLHGEDVFIASPGDIVDHRYRLVNILLNSVEVEDIPNNNKQTLPLAPN